MSDDMHAIGDSVERLRRQLGMDDPRRLHELRAAWPQLVGEELAAHSRPVAIKHETLVIEVDGPGWAAPVRYLADSLVARVGGGVERVQTRVANGR